MSTSPESRDPDDAAPVDPVISDAVHTVSNRFGTQGLADLIALAREELAAAEAALKELDSLD
ncbi:MAG: hypothetical protein WBQ50_18000 [Nocardioides sp.]